MTDDVSSPAVALLFADKPLGAHLREALQSLGARIVHEGPPASVTRAQLVDSGADVVVVNLDDSDDDQVDHLYDVIDEDRQRVIFNDAAASGALSGADRARWARHLAVKLLGRGDVDPPRPASAPTIDVPVAGLTAGITETTPEPIAEAQPTFEAQPTSAAESPFETERTATDDAVCAPVDEVLAATEPNLSGTHLMDESLADSEASIPPDAVADDVRSSPAHEVMDSPVVAASMEDAGPTLSPVVDDAAGDMPESFETIELDSLPTFDLDTSFGTGTGTGTTDAPDEQPDATDVEATTASAPQWSMAASNDADGEPGEDIGDANAFEQAPAIELTVGEFELDTVTSSNDEGDADIPIVDDAASLESDLAELSAFVESRLAEGEAQEDAATPWSMAPNEDVPVDEPDPDASADLRMQHTHEATVEDSETLAGAQTAPADTPVATQEASVQSPAIIERQVQSSLPPVEEWDLVDFDKQQAAVKTPEKDDNDAMMTGVEKVSATDYLAPHADDDDAFGEPHSTLQLVSMEEALAPSSGEPTLIHEMFLDGISAAIRRLVVLAAAPEGAKPACAFVGALQSPLPAVVVVVEHHKVGDTARLKAELEAVTSHPVRLIQDGMQASKGDILVLPAGNRCQIGRDGRVSMQAVGSRDENDPSIDDCLISAASTFGADMLAVIFAGDTNDALAGAQAVYDRRGRVWVQDPKTCTVNGMVSMAIEDGVVDFIGSPGALATRLHEVLA